MKKPAVVIFSILLIGILAAGIFFLQANVKYNREIENAVVVTDSIPAEEIPVPEIRYGMIVDSFNVQRLKVERNETLEKILGRYNISPELINRIADSSKSIYDLSRIQAGKPYTVFCTKEGADAKCFIYKANPMEHVVVKLDTSVHVYMEEIKVDTTIRSIGGVINSSFYETLLENNVTPDMASNLARVFAWQIDFFRIYAGDNFKVVYEEISVDGKPVKSGKILAASFNQYGKEYYAFNFHENGEEKFFNEEGKNVRGAFLKAPLKYFRITSKFTKKRFHPVQKRYKAHLGTDYAAPTGTPIIAVGSGTVVEAKYSKFNGNYVKIKHNGTYTTQYLHMSRIAKGMRPGKKVTQGMVIGYVGSTGLATGPHVCFRFWQNGKQVDHTKVKVVQTDPLKKENFAAFEKYKEEMMKKLEEIQLENVIVKKNEGKQEG